MHFRVEQLLWHRAALGTARRILTLTSGSRGFETVRPVIRRIV
jgi:hypothetical protein